VTQVFIRHNKFLWIREFFPEEVIAAICSAGAPIMITAREIVTFFIKERE
jgi:hypothetical protein